MQSLYLSSSKLDSNIFYLLRLVRDDQKAMKKEGNPTICNNMNGP